MLRRKIYQKLLEWKGRPHKPLVITGQRQVGKTYIVREFARNEYASFLEINFAENPQDRMIFDGSLSPEKLIARLSVSYPGIDIVPGGTLIFLDEIQDCMGAYASLKYLSDTGMDVIASGSLLGVRMPGVQSGSDALIPLGYTESHTMYSMDFEEFLWARGVSEAVISGIRGCIRDCEPIDDVILDRISSYHREFMAVGGMPASVEAFVDSGNFTGSRRILSELNLRCTQDINRYNSGIDILKTAECYDSIPDQLAEANKKFMYSRIRGEGSRRAADRYSENLLWIKGAGYGNFCYAAADVSLPLKSRRDSFKIYQSDTGMLVSRYGEACLKAVYEGRGDYNNGAIAENAVAEALMKEGYSPRYYSVTKGANHMELDFLVETGDGICAIEVKSGKDRTAPSIGKARTIYDIARCIFLENGNIRRDADGMEHYPLFAASFFRELEPAWDGPALRDGFFPCQQHSSGRGCSEPGNPGPDASGVPLRPSQHYGIGRGDRHRTLFWYSGRVRRQYLRNSDRLESSLPFSIL